MAGQQQTGGVGEHQRASQKFIVFSDIEKMNTRPARTALAEKEAAWMENLQPVAPNNLACTPAALAALTTITGYTITAAFGANISALDYVIGFSANGAGIAIETASGGQLVFAPAGTFSPSPDMTVYASQRILIMDSRSGYSTWDGVAFVAAGGVSPHITVTAGGAGYTTIPVVAITGGSGTGATAVAIISGGSVISVTLTSGGTGYVAGDVLTVTFGGPGVGAAATVIVWPVFTGNTIAVFAGRVWTGNGRVLSYTGTNGFDDTNPANAAGSTTISDADLSHSITAVRNLDNYLFIFGDSSVRQIGSISVASGITLFTPLTLTSDVGCPFPRSIASYNRLVLFAAKTGVWAIFGASVEKISDDLDGIFQSIDFTLAPSAALNDIRNIHCYLLLVRYVDPLLGSRSIMVAYQAKKWFVVSQGDNLVAITSLYLSSTQQITTYGTSGSDITQLLGNPFSPVQITLRTALSPHGNPVQDKKTIRFGLGATVAGFETLSLSLDTEGQSVSATLLAQPTAASSFQYPYTTISNHGKYLGATLSASVVNFALNVIAIEYQDGALWGSATPSPSIVTSAVAAVGTFTLTANATSTIVPAAESTSASIVFYVALTPDGANDMATTSVTAGAGRFTLDHASNARIDRTFAYVILDTVLAPAIFPVQIGQFTLTPNGTATVVTAAACVATSVVLFSPITADGANDMATTSVTAAAGHFTLAHANNARVDRTFSYAVFDRATSGAAIKTGAIALTPGASSTTIPADCTAASVIPLSPLTFDAANEMATTSIAATTGQFTANYASNDRTDRIFNFAIIG